MTINNSRPGEMFRRKHLGRVGEKVSRAFLESKDFRIIGANYRSQGGEIDIIARKGRLIVFCEVKTRLGEEVSTEGYSNIQRQRLVESSERFLAENEYLLPVEFELRYDVILVGQNQDGHLIVKEHIEDAFRPE